MASAYPPKKNSAFTLLVEIRDADGDLVSGATGLDSEISKDGAGFTDCSNEAVEFGTTGIYSLALTAAEMNADVIAIQVKTSTSGAKTFTAFIYTTESTWDEGIDVKAVLTGAIVAASFGAGAIDAAAIATDAIDADAIAANAIGSSEIGTDAINADALAADAIIEIRSVASGQSDAGGSTTTMVDAARAEADTDYWKGMILVMTSGAAAGQARLITGFNAATDTITVAPAFTQSIGAGMNYEIWPSGVADVRQWLGVTPSALVAGRVDADVGAMQLDVLTAAAIAPNAIGASELATDAVTEIQSGLATSASLSSVATGVSDIQSRLPAALVSGKIDASVGAMADNVITAAALAADAGTELADALLKRDMSAVSGEAARSPLNALRFLRNYWEIAGGTLTVKKEDDAATAWTAVVTQTAGNPVSKIDPA